MSVGEEFQKYTYEYLLNQALDRVPDNVDKREGSIIFDALAPSCYLLAGFYLDLAMFSENTYMETATDEWLSLRAAEFGIKRKKATQAKRIGRFYSSGVYQGEYRPMDVAIGSRFYSLSDADSVVFSVEKQVVDGEGLPVTGEYEIACESFGSIGNQYEGQLIPVDFIPNLVLARAEEMISLGEDEETDEALRLRALQAVSKKAFGGNVADYYRLITDISGIGGVQVYPAWAGGGTVKVSVVDTSFNPINDEGRLLEIQNYLDPENSEGITGTGIGQVPIGHKVTVVTPVEVPISFDFNNVYSKPGYTLEQVRQELIQILGKYIEELRLAWDKGDIYNTYSTGLYNVKIISAAASAKSLESFWEVDINNQRDLVLTQNSTVQEIPVLGEVVFSVG